MINLSKRCIFVHIPKTGGNSIDAALKVKRHKEYLKRGAPFHLSPSHITASQIRFLLKQNVNNTELWDSCFKFAFVRNPWDQRVSQFFHQRKGKGEGGAIASRRRTSKGFKHFLLNYGLDITIRKRTQLDYLTGAQDDEILVDFIGRFENFEEDFKRVCKEAGYGDVKLPHYNKTKHKHYTDYYTDETREIVANVHKRDIETFGYKFGE